MKPADNTVINYVNKWLGKINDPNLNDGDRICVAYEFSVNIRKQINHYQLTHKQIYRALREKIQATHSRDLIRLRQLPKALILRLSSHAEKGKKGASYLQVLYAMRLPKVWRAPILIESMNEELDCKSLAERVDALTCDEFIRPRCWTKQSERVFKQFMKILTDIGGEEFSDSLDRLAPVRRRAAVVSLHHMIERIDLISKKIPRAVDILTLSQAHLQSESLYGSEYF